MRSFFPTFRFGPSLSLRAALLLLAAGAFGACDRHSAEEVPENYGHGSSHDRARPDHQADSNGPQHFSDSAGAHEEEVGGGHEKPAASPTATPASRVF